MLPRLCRPACPAPSAKCCTKELKIFKLSLSNRGNTTKTKRTANVNFGDIFNAKNDCDHLLGFNMCNKYFLVLYYNENRAFQKLDTKEKEEQLKLLEKYGINVDLLK